MVGLPRRVPGECILPSYFITRPNSFHLQSFFSRHHKNIPFTVCRIPGPGQHERLDDRLQPRVGRARRVLPGRGVEPACRGQVRGSVRRPRHRAIRGGRPRRRDARNRVQSRRSAGRSVGPSPAARQVAENHRCVRHRTVRATMRVPNKIVVPYSGSH